MSLATRIESLVIRVAQEFNDVRATAGNLASLSTTDKSSLVAAINELKAAVLSATAIDDNQIATSTTYSSNKIVSLLDALKASAGFHTDDEETDGATSFTTPDHRLTIRTVACFGQCALAPVAAIDETIHGHITDIKLRKLVAAIEDGLSDGAPR